MIPYLLHSSILLSGCFIFYWLFIRKETFFKLNRWVLISGILLSVLIPLIQIPETWSLRKENISELIPEPVLEIEHSTIENALLADRLKTQGETKISTPKESIMSEVSNEESSESIFNNFIPISTILWYIYLAGVIIFFLAFLLQLIIILTKMYSYVSYQDGRYRIVELVKDEAPYSFWNSIFINPTRYDLETYTQILNHEKIHIRQAHFFDKILSEILLIAFWFNPFVWFYRSAITNNLEYLTDSSMLEEGVERQSYQMSLLKVSVPQHPLNLSTNYNNSFLKNRIAMMNSKKSSARSSWKYMFLIPLIGFSMISMNETTIVENNLTSNSLNDNLELQDTIPGRSDFSESSGTKGSSNTVITTQPLSSTSSQTIVQSTSINDGPSTTTTTKTSVYSETDPQIIRTAKCD